jgi:hypothetical protein
VGAHVIRRTAALAAVVVLGIGVALAVTRTPGSRSAQTYSLPGVLLPWPNAAYVRLEPGCVWGTGAKTLTISRHTGQGINIVNLGTAAHLFVQTAGPASPLPAWPLPPASAFGVLWSSQGVVSMTTCSGSVTLNVKVSA